MILSGEKKEEYREIKPHWIERLTNKTNIVTEHFYFRKFTQIEFKNGYDKNSPTILVECKGIEVGKAVPKWSDNWPGEVFVIKLGKILKRPNEKN